MSKVAHLLLSVLLLSILGVAAPRRIPANLLPYESVDTENWVAQGVATSQNPLVYVSVLTGLHSGATEIYEIANGGATLVGHLNRGGGGSLAVDSQQNVYVIQADYDQNLYQQHSHVFVYPRGSKDPSRDFVARGFGAEAMTVAADGTVYMAGQRYPNTTLFRAIKFAPGSSTAQWLPKDSQEPSFPTGIAVDSSGNLFVGWTGADADPCGSGCIEFLAAGKKRWQTRLPDLAANAVEAGPFVKADGSLILWTGQPGRFNYIETVQSGRKMPSQVAQLPPDLLPGSPLTAALNNDGTEIWGMELGLGAGPGSSVYQIDYPSGKVSLSFQVNNPKKGFYAIGLAVSPTYYPGTLNLSHEMAGEP